MTENPHDLFWREAIVESPRIGFKWYCPVCDIHFEHCDCHQHPQQVCDVCQGVNHAAPAPDLEPALPTCRWCDAAFRSRGHYETSFDCGTRIVSDGRVVTDHYRTDECRDRESGFESPEIAGRGPDDCSGCSSHRSMCCCDELAGPEPDLPTHHCTCDLCSGTGDYRFKPCPKCRQSGLPDIHKDLAVPIHLTGEHADRMTQEQRESVIDSVREWPNCGVFGCPVETDHFHPQSKPPILGVPDSEAFQRSDDGDTFVTEARESVKQYWSKIDKERFQQAQQLIRDGDVDGLVLMLLGVPRSETWNYDTKSYDKVVSEEPEENKNVITECPCGAPLDENGECPVFKPRNIPAVKKELVNPIWVEKDSNDAKGAADSADPEQARASEGGQGAAADAPDKNSWIPRFSNRHPGIGMCSGCGDENPGLVCGECCQRMIASQVLEAREEKLQPRGESERIAMRAEIEELRADRQHWIELWKKAANVVLELQDLPDEVEKLQEDLEMAQWQLANAWEDARPIRESRDAHKANSKRFREERDAWQQQAEGVNEDLQDAHQTIGKLYYALCRIEHAQLAQAKDLRTIARRAVDDYESNLYHDRP